MYIAQEVIAWADIDADGDVVASMGLVGDPVDVTTTRTFTCVANDLNTSDRVALFHASPEPAAFDSITLATEVSGTWRVITGVSVDAIVGAFTFMLVRFTLGE